MPERVSNSAYQTAIFANDLDAARAVIDDMLERGVSAAAIIDEVIAPTQKTIGDHWQSGEWTIAREHAATEISSRMASFLETRSPPPRPERRILVASAEGEWHSLGGLLVSVGLRSAGHPVTSLGGPVPSGQLIPLIHDLGPRLLVVSCAMPANLYGAKKVIEVARETGLAVVAGGSAVTPARALKLGSYAYLPDVRSLLNYLDRKGPITRTLPESRSQRDEEASRLARITGELSAKLASAVMAEQLGEGVDTARDLGGDGLFLLRALQSAVLLDEVDVFGNHLNWQIEVDPERSELTRRIVEIMQTVIPPGFERSRAVLDAVR
jgi:methanogenic corrinoid protein MtbC1